MLLRRLTFIFLSLGFLLNPFESNATTKLVFNGSSSGTMFLSAPSVASGTVILPTLNGSTSYLIDGTRKVSTVSPLNGGGSLSGDLSLSLNLDATYQWGGVQNYSVATSILPNSLGLPSTCSPASIYVNLSGSTSQKLYVCEANNTWVAVGSSVASTTLDNNFTASTDPTPNDDTPDYSVGSRWVNTTDKTQFIAVDVTSTAARWFRSDTGNARFTGSRYGGTLDLNYYDVAGASTSDLPTKINFWTNSYANPGNLESDTTIERGSGDNGNLNITNRGEGNVFVSSGNDVIVTVDSDDDNAAYFYVLSGDPTNNIVLSSSTDGSFIAQSPSSTINGGNGVVMSSSGVLTKQNNGSIVADAVTSGTPINASDACTAGSINYDADYIYICVATNTWKRSSLSTW